MKSVALVGLALVACTSHRVAAPTLVHRPQPDGGPAELAPLPLLAVQNAPEDLGVNGLEVHVAPSDDLWLIGDDANDLDGQSRVALLVARATPSHTEWRTTIDRICPSSASDLVLAGDGAVVAYFKPTEPGGCPDFSPSSFAPWNGAAKQGVFLQRIDGDGARLWSTFVRPTERGRGSAWLATDARGRVFVRVFWTVTEDGGWGSARDYADLLAFDEDGKPLWSTGATPAFPANGRLAVTDAGVWVVESTRDDRPRLELFDAHDGKSLRAVTLDEGYVFAVASEGPTIRVALRTSAVKVTVVRIDAAASVLAGKSWSVAPFFDEGRIDLDHASP